MSDILFTSNISVSLVQALASDDQVIHAAKVSFNSKNFGLQGVDRKRFINYLMVNRHGSPFEHGLFTFRVRAPLFVVQQMLRHRAGHSYNQESGRYHEFEPVFYVPAEFREQVGKPGAYEYVPLTHEANERYTRGSYEDACKKALASYKDLLHTGVAKEQARGVLPTTLMTSLWWSCNPRSLMHWLSLRDKFDAQAEIREVARQVQLAFGEYMPLTRAAFYSNDMVAP